MKKTILLMMLVLIGVSLGYCRDIWFPYTWHQKITLEVEVDGQVYTGSSVVGVSWHKNDPIGAANGPTWISDINGEAPFVELSGHGVLFGLLSFSENTSYAADLTTRLLTGRTGWARGNEEFAEVQAVKGKKLTVPVSHYPLLVTFTDITDPTTVQKVDPGNLAATLGPGVQLKRITLEITDEPVTEGKIEEVLGWLGPHPEPTLGRSADIFKPIFAATVHHGDFIRR